MSVKSSIEWTDSSWTPIRAKVKMDAAEIASAKGYASLVQIATQMAGRIGPHCERCSPGCENCYSETNNGRCLPSNGTGLPFDRRSRDLVELFVDEKILMQPPRWKSPRKVFVCSQTDLFGDFVSDADIDRVFVVMALCPQHTFQVLTKRADRMREYFENPDLQDRLTDLYGKEGWQVMLPMPNVWLGVSVEDQQRANERIPYLLQTPAAVRFLSVEPLLGPVDLSAHSIPEMWLGGIHWVIVGGESGPGARPCDITWIRSIVALCKAAGVPVFVKQLGANVKGYNPHGTWVGKELRPHFYDKKGGDMAEWPEDLRVREMPR